jgi:excisionase family DNA binding protein
MGRTDENFLKDKRFAARYLGVSVHKIHKMVRDGSGPKFVKIGPLVRFTPEALAEFVQTNTHGGKAAGPDIAERVGASM